MGITQGEAVMRMTKNIVATFFILALLNSHVAVAGPIFDLLMERKATQKSGEGLEDHETSDRVATLPQGVKVLHDIPYGNDGKQRMDVYLPSDAPKSAPVILMVHGGAWRVGDKASQAVVQNKIARWVPRGFIFVSVNYRLLPKADPLQQAEDVARALAKAQAQATSWGGNSSKFILMGHSAGAHLIALLGAEPSKAIGIGAKPWLGTISLDSAALDVVQIMEAKHAHFYDRAFGAQPTYWRSTSPLHVLTASASPMLVVCSTRRKDACLQARSISAHASSIGAHIKILEQDLSHREVNETLGLDGAYTDAVEAFMGSLDMAVMKALTTPSKGMR